MDAEREDTLSLSCTFEGLQHTLRILRLDGHEPTRMTIGPTGWQTLLPDLISRGLPPDPPDRLFGIPVTVDTQADYAVAFAMSTQHLAPPHEEDD